MTHLIVLLALAQAPGPSSQPVEVREEQLKEKLVSEAIQRKEERKFRMSNKVYRYPAIEPLWKSWIYFPPPARARSVRPPLYNPLSDGQKNGAYSK